MTSSLLLLASLLVLATLGTPHASRAQEIQGVAVDARGEALPGVTVALHRVDEAAGGSNVAATTTDDHGRFQFQVEPPDSALYFAAMRHDGRMYIGSLALPGIERVTGYVLSADPSAEAGAVASALSRVGAAAAPDQRTGTAGQGAAQLTGQAAALVALLALTAGLLLVFTVPRYRRRRTREALIELASLENRLASEADQEDRGELVLRRDQLRDRLAPPA